MFKGREASTGTMVRAGLETVSGCGRRLGAGPAGSRRGQRPRDPGGQAWEGAARGQGAGLACAHPLVDGVRLAQRALCGRDAVGDAPVALAQTPQLAADLLRPRCPLKLALLPQEDPGSLPAGQWAPGFPGIFWTLWQGMAWALLSAYIRTALMEHLCVAYIPVDIFLPIPLRENQGQVRSLAEGYTATKGQPGYQPRPLTEGSMM